MLPKSQTNGLQVQIFIQNLQNFLHSKKVLKRGYKNAKLNKYLVSGNEL